MLAEIDLIKGIHPGLVLDKKLKDQEISKGQFALSVREYPQTITAITKGKRSMNTALALKIEKFLGLEEGYFMILQVYYDIKQEKLKTKYPPPELSRFRPAIFWDTSMENIDWQRQFKAVIRRVFERGNKKEKDEITRYYGKEKVDFVLKHPIKTKDLK